MRSQGSRKTPTRPGRLAVICFALLLISATAASGASKGVIGFFGNPGAVPSPNGAEFSTTPGGVAVNNSSGDVYVVDSGNNRVQQFDENGDFVRSFGIDVAGDGNELQRLTVQANGGTFTVSFNGASTPSLPFNVTAAELQNALAALATIGAGNVSVIGGPGNNTGAFPYLVTFTGALGHADQPPLETTKSLTGSNNKAEIATLANGFAGPAPDNANEIQAVMVNASGGQFRLSFGAGGPGVAETGDIPSSASASEVQSALNALSNISAGSGSVRVSGGPGDSGGTTPYLVDFGGGVLAGTDVAQMVGLSGTTPLSGGTGVSANEAMVSTFAPGGGTGTGYEICEVQAKCKAGTAAATGGGMSNPQGVAIDQATGNLYVSDPGLQRIDEFDASGNFIRSWGRNVIASGPGSSPLANAVQKLTVKATGGKFTLEYQGQKTGALPFDTSAAAVQAALIGLSTIGAGNVEVIGGPGDETGTTPYSIIFKGALANTPVATILAASDATEPLTGGIATAGIEVMAQGSNEFEICTAAAVCQKGVSTGATAGSINTSTGYLTVVPAGAPNAGNLLVGEFRRVQEFAADGSFVRAFGWDVVSVGPGNTGTAFEICRAAIFDVCKAGTTGAGLGQFGGNPGAPSPARIAVDTSGAIYTVESGVNFRVQKFSLAGENLTPALFCPDLSVSETLCGASSADTPIDVAIDLADNHVFVVKAFPSERRILEFDSSGALVDTHISGYNVTSVNGIAIKAGGEPIYLTSSTPKSGVHVVGEPIPPQVAVEATTAITANSALLHGRVNPSGGGPLHTTYHFEYRAVGEVAWSKAPPTDVDIGSGEADIPVSESISGLQPNKAYEVRLVAIKGGSPVISTGSTGNFSTDPAAPDVETFAAFYDTSSGELVLRGGVNPNNTATSYFFEYGTEPCEAGVCTTTSTGSAGAGGAMVTESERIVDLESATTYHFRIMAENGVGGSVKGVEAVITTPAEEACGNVQFRIGASVKLAECRAYERVSNGDSWGNGVRPFIGAIGDGGDRAEFFAQAFDQPESAPAASNPYIAERTDAGWTVRSILPEAGRASGSVGGRESMTSPDLGTVLWPESTVGERIRGEVTWTLSHMDGDRNPASGKLSPLSLGAIAASNGYGLVGAAANLSNFVFRFDSGATLGFGVTLIPGEPQARRSSNLYEIAGASNAGPGVLRIVNRGGSASAENPMGVIGGVCGAGLGAGVKGFENAYRAISSDGSTIYFSAEPNASSVGECSEGSGKRLYKRLNGLTTTEVSAPQCTPTPACPGSPAGDDNYRGASTDGEIAIFTTPRRLTNSDGDSSLDLYLYDTTPPAGESTLVQASAGETVGPHITGSGAEVIGVLDNAGDGSRAYFVAKGVLSGPNTQDRSPEAGSPNLYVYQRDGAHPEGRIAFIGTLPVTDSSDWAGSTNRTSFALPGGVSGEDGHVLLFVSAGQLLREDADSARDLYRYDDQSGALACLSCMGDGNFDVRTAIRSISSSASSAAQLARPASAALDSVVFATAEPLVGGDLNATDDVYLWRNGALSLISVGAGGLGSQRAGGGERELGISPDGKNVFFVTQAALVADDVNNGLDFYDARVEGGFKGADPVVECDSDEACHGPLQTAPDANLPASATAVSPGNLTPPKRCKKGQVRKKGKCVKKPVKRKARKQQKAGKKRAGADRGGKR